MVDLYKNRQASINKRNSVLESPKMDSDIEKRARVESNPGVTFDRDALDKVLKILERFSRFIRGDGTKSNWPYLISGSRGIGKTSLVEEAANQAKLKLTIIPLKTLERTRNEFKVTIDSFLMSEEPAILLFDDIDQVNEEFQYVLRNAILKSLEKNFLVFCTTSSLEIINGVEFKPHIHLKRPDINARFMILKQLRDSNQFLSNLTDEYLRFVATNTPSFTPSNLKMMLDIAEEESNGYPTIKDCDKAICAIKQSFERGTHLIAEKPTVTWDNIGGLPKVRREFAEILREVKHGVINCKFAGIALFGPPGCGKTMVAQAMANEAGLNFISVKPAELVDKFLGETEKNIRRVFSEAKEYEPCMIYFDEFDGLCGTRGNKDNITGAIQTLLSEMDGIASRGQSIILASTNRLEDIDPAMKRPGRLSKHIYVGPPNELGRKDILKVIIDRQSLNLAPDVDLDDCAKKTIMFTGADLDFLIAQAKSKAFSETNPNEMDSQKLVLKLTHIEYALRKIKRMKKRQAVMSGHQ